jgi:F0F1-type ATP synthase membrane subunit c/vacuolar-type H+-ATPase subunit K
MMIGLNEALHRRRVLLWIAMVVCAMGIALATSHPHGPGADAEAPAQHSLTHVLCGIGEVLCAIALLVGFVLIGVRRLRGPPWVQIARATGSALPSLVLSPRPPSLLMLSRLQR